MHGAALRFIQNFFIYLWLTESWTFVLWDVDLGFDISEFAESLFEDTAVFVEYLFQGQVLFDCEYHLSVEAQGGQPVTADDRRSLSHGDDQWQCLILTIVLHRYLNRTSHRNLASSEGS